MTNSLLKQVPRQFSLMGRRVAGVFHLIFLLIPSTFMLKCDQIVFLSSVVGMLKSRCERMYWFTYLVCLFGR